MKFLIDAQLPPVLQRVMNREGFEAVHAKDLGLAPSKYQESKPALYRFDLKSEVSIEGAQLWPIAAYCKVQAVETDQLPRFRN